MVGSVWLSVSWVCFNVCSSGDVCVVICLEGSVWFEYFG